MEFLVILLAVFAVGAYVAGRNMAEYRRAKWDRRQIMKNRSRYRQR